VGLSNTATHLALTQHYRNAEVDLRSARHRLRGWVSCNPPKAKLPPGALDRATVYDSSVASLSLSRVSFPVEPSAPSRYPAHSPTGRVGYFRNPSFSYDFLQKMKTDPLAVRTSRLKWQVSHSPMGGNTGLIGPKTCRRQGTCARLNSQND